MRTIRIGLAGNPNSGKTCIFNLLTGLQQHVGNWPGVTVERKVGRLDYQGYRFEVTDLPGTYSLTSYSIEERIAREYILNEQPDIIINVVDAANLERNLHLTTQLLEMGVDVIVDLNMWDEFTRMGAKLDVKRLEELLGTPTVTTEGHRCRGREALLDAILRLVEDRSERHRHIPVSLGTRVEEVIVDLSRRVDAVGGEALGVPARYLATKLLEGDPHIVEVIHNRLSDPEPLLLAAEEARQHIRTATGLEPARVLAEGRYGFIDGLRREVLQEEPIDRMQFSRQVDRVLTHRVLGLPIFLAFMWLLFNATFTLGAYPTAWIESLIGLCSDLARDVLPAGLLTDLVAEGIIAGVGAVAAFLPNIIILFLGISLLEDSGYMARVAFIMDRVMHLFGLHGKSFIPMLMGFGCSVPAIMATRMLESRRDRILTSLLLPHMSCSARLPVFVLFAGTFFARHAGTVVGLMYLLGILVALALGLIFSRTFLRAEEASFVMELPPYRWPTTTGLVMHVWGRSRMYLRKMGGVILIASIILWVLGTFPRHPEADQMARARDQRAAQGASPTELAHLDGERALAEIEYTVIGRIGKAIAPVVAPLGFDWRMGVSLVTGFVAKEVVISTMGVLYWMSDVGDTGEEEGLRRALQHPRSGITPLIALGFMVFVLLYTPCVAAVLTIRREFGMGWMAFDIAYQLVLAWGAAFVVVQGGRVLGLG